MQTNETNTREQKTTLVLGGTGKTGRRVVERLGALGMPVRVGSRSAQPPFDWDLPSTWQSVLQGIDQVYVTYQPDLAFPGAAETIDQFARLAVENGVKRLVLLSGRNEEGALRGEEFVQNAGAEWTIVRSTTFAQNFSEGFFVEAVQAGELAVPAGNVAEPFIDLEDVVDIVVAALTTDKHAGRLYEVTGPRLVTFAEAAGEISAAIGRNVTYVPTTLEEFAAALTQAGLPEDLVGGLTELFGMIFDGRNASVTDGVQQALGRPARDFSDFVRSAAATGVWNPPAQV